VGDGKTLVSERNARFYLAILIILPTIILVGLILLLGKDTAQTTRLDVVNSFLAVFGVWIGAVIAFYFGSENMETAQRGIRETMKTLGPDRLKKIQAKEVMLTPVYAKRADDKIEDAVELMKEKNVRSIVVVDKISRPLGLLFNYEIMEYIAIKPEKYEDIVKNDIREVMESIEIDRSIKWKEGVVRNNFLPVYSDMALATIKTNLETRKLYLAIVLGVKDEAIGILSRLEILKEASMVE